MKANKFIIFFLLKATGLYLLWFLIYDLWLKKVGLLDDLIVDNIVYVVYKILSGFNYVVHIDHHDIGLLNPASNVTIANSCGGLEMLTLFSGFVIIFEGSWKNKIWFIPLGILVLHFMNILRVIGLILTGNYLGLEVLQFNHHYTFAFILYGLTFIGWMIWVKYFSKLKS